MENPKPDVLPDLHLQAMFIKNRKRLQHDGGRAWIKDGQLHDAVKGANDSVFVSSGTPAGPVSHDSAEGEKTLGELIKSSYSIRKM